MGAAAEPPSPDCPPDVATPSAGGGGAAAALDVTRTGKKVLAVISRGNTRKGWNAFGAGGVVPASEGAAMLTALTPQVLSPPPSIMADEPGAPEYDLRPKIFNAELDSLRTCIGTGTLHSSYERIRGTTKHGERAFLFNIAHAVCCGKVHEGLAVELAHLHALCVYKPDGSHRPLGLPEPETRFFLGCLAAQERPSWSRFYTSPLPATAAAQARDVKRAVESLALAEDAATRSRDALARAQLAEDAAAAAEGLAEMGRTRDHAYAATGELQRCGGAVADAAASIKQAKAPRNHPVNLAFSPGGSTALSQLVDTWQEAKPTDHLIPDDITNRYNNQSLHASFEAMREHQADIIPVTRLI